MQLVERQQNLVMHQLEESRFVDPDATVCQLPHHIRSNLPFIHLKRWDDIQAVLFAPFHNLRGYACIPENATEGAAEQKVT